MKGLLAVGFFCLALLGCGLALASVIGMPVAIASAPTYSLIPDHNPTLNCPNPDADLAVRWWRPFKRRRGCSGGSCDVEPPSVASVTTKQLSVCIV